MLKPIAIAYSGSGFLASVHVGALTAVIDAGYDPLAPGGRVDATSGGSVVAGLYAAGMDIVDITQLALIEDFSSLLGLSLLSPFKEAAYCNGNNLLAWLENKTGNKTLADIGSGLNIVATDLAKGCKVLLNATTYPDMPLALAIRASTAIPGVYAGVQYAGMYLVDGGVTCNFDLADLPKAGVPKLGIELTRSIVPMTTGEYSALWILERLAQVILFASESAQEQIGELEDAVIATADVTGYDMLDTSMHYSDRALLLNRGYEAAEAALKRLALPKSVV